MKRFSSCLLCVSILTISLVGCGEASNLPEDAGVGPNPVLPKPEPSLLPMVNIAPAEGFAEGETPIAAPGLEVSAYARDLDHPRTLHVLPNGDVLVAETNGPAKPAPKSPVAWVRNKYMERAGARVPSADRITLLRGIKENGEAQLRTLFLADLHSPFGMALVGEYLYVANTDAVMRFPYSEGDTEIAAPGEKIVDLPAGELNHHWTKDLIASPDGQYLYVTVGSNSNAGENGMDMEEGRAAVHQITIATGEMRLFASGLRNPNGPAWEPETGALWVVVNERDEIGNDLVPDYMTSVQDGGFYGWPYSYYGQHVDERIEPARPDLVAEALVPDYALGAHTACLGLTFYTADLFPEEYHGGAFIGQHGSWNRKPHSGYKVIFVPFEAGRPTGEARDILSGFLNEDGKALGRPVGVTVNNEGALLVADDVANTVWRVTPASTLVRL